MSSEHAVVIGGGITGLVRAHELLKRGAQVTIVEPGALGGLIQSSHKSGFTMEHGPNVVLEKPELAALIDELGLRSKVVRPAIPKYRQYVWYNGAPCEVPKSPPKLIFTPLIPFADKCRLLPQLFAKGIVRSGEDDLSVHDLFSRIIGPTAATNILNPALRGIFGGDTTKLGARSLFPELFAELMGGGSIVSYLRSKGGAPRPTIFTLRGGIGELPKALVERMKSSITLVSSSVRNITRSEKGFVVECENGTYLKGSSVHITTSGSASSKFVSGLAPDLAESLRAVEYAGLVVVHAGIKREKPLLRDAFGILFPSHSSQTFLGAMFNSTLFPHVAPPDKHLVTICLGGVHGGAVFDMADDETVALARREVGDKLGLVNLEHLSLWRWRKAIPQYAVGHYRIEERMKRCEIEYPGLHFLGTDRGGNGVPNRVKAAVSF